MLGHIDNRLSQSKIYDYIQDLKECKAKIKKLKRTSTKKFSSIQQYRHETMIQMELKRKKWITEKLVSMGYNPDGRGRPRSDSDEKSGLVRTKLTIKVKSGYVSLLKELKVTGKINNISSFIEKLIEDYVDINSSDIFN